MLNHRENAFIQVLCLAPFRNLWFSQVISQVFLNLLVFALIIRIYELTNSNVAVSILVLTISVPNFFLGAIAGVFVDRWDRKIVMFLSHFLRFVAVIAFLLSSESLPWIYTLTILISIITQFFVPAEAATIYEVVKDKRILIGANSLFSLTFFASIIVGNVLAGPILQLVGFHWTLVFVSLAFLAAAFSSAQLPGVTIRQWARDIVTTYRHFNSQTLPRLSRRELFAEFFEGLKFVNDHHLVRHGIILMAIAQIIVGTLSAIAPGIATTLLGVKVVEVSLVVMAPAALGMIVGAILIGSFFTKIKKERLIESGFIAAALTILVLAATDSLAVALHLPTALVGIAVLAALGLGNAFLDVPINTIIQENTPLTIRSRVYGVVGTFSGGGSIVPVLAAGAIADTFGVRSVLLILGGILFVIAIFNRQILRRLERLESEIPTH